MTTMHTLEMMPTAIARGAKAKAAWDRWTRTARRHAGPRIAYTAPEQVARLPVGTGVWVRCKLLKDAGCEWLRGHILGIDEMTGRYHVCNIDEPRCQWYAPRLDLMPRFAGEVEPGLTAPAAIARHGARATLASVPRSGPSIPSHLAGHVASQFASHTDGGAA
jgi:hypothetical protein